MTEEERINSCRAVIQNALTTFGCAIRITDVNIYALADPEVEQSAENDSDVVPLETEEDDGE